MMDETIADEWMDVLTGVLHEKCNVGFLATDIQVIDGCIVTIYWTGFECIILTLVPEHFL